MLASFCSRELADGWEGLHKPFVDLWVTPHLQNTVSCHRNRWRNLRVSSMRSYPLLGPTTEWPSQPPTIHSSITQWWNQLSRHLGWAQSSCRGLNKLPDVQVNQRESEKSSAQLLTSAKPASSFLQNPDWTTRRDSIWTLQRTGVTSPGEHLPPLRTGEFQELMKIFVL